jgi:cyclic beta-1,2-glucan synthetase
LRRWRRAPGDSPWDGVEILRSEAFGVERLEQHAESLAVAQSVTAERCCG